MFSGGFISTCTHTGQKKQGRIYIGASGSMAPGPEVPGGPFEDANKKWESYSIKFEGAPGPD